MQLILPSTWIRRSRPPSLIFDVDHSRVHSDVYHNDKERSGVAGNADTICKSEEAQSTSRPL